MKESWKHWSIRCKLNRKCWTQFNRKDRFQDWSWPTTNDERPTTTGKRPTTKKQADPLCRVQDKGNTLSFDMECGDAKQILIAVSMTITFADARHFTGTIKSNVAYGGKTVTSDKQLNSKWVAAACKKQ